MDLSRLLRIKMMQEHIMFVYRGIVTNENSVPLLMLLEKEMEHSEFAFTGRKRLFMFVLESLQNVSRHTNKGPYADMSLVIYSKSNTGYTVTTGNVLHSSGIKDLKTKLDNITSLQPDELRSVYRQMLSSAEFTSKGGAGLGLIEMAKKTGNKLDYDFLPINDEYSYFILSKTVGSGVTENHDAISGKSFNSNVASELERLMAENRIYLLWSGHISPDMRKEVLSFTEMKFAEEDLETNMRKRVFGVLAEILENIARFSPGREPEEQFGMPFGVISLEDKVYSLTTGNLIINRAVDQLKVKLDTINEYDREGLKELFRKTLSGNSNRTENPDIGLIDMARKSGSKLMYRFDKINELYSYYTLKVKVEDKY